MIIAIHHREGSFSDTWLKYCEEKRIKFKIVDAYSSDIIKDLSDVTHFMWHHDNDNSKDKIFAKELLYAISSMGLKTYPNFATTWHFDDKLGQKYLFDAIGVPSVKSWVFYSKSEAFDWLTNAEFPIVFKLRGGSGSSNVQLLDDQTSARKVVRKAFGRGFSQFDRIRHLKFRYKNVISGKESVVAILKGLALLFLGKEYSNRSPREKSYLYFQEFMPNNDHDVRVVVVGEKAVAMKRLVRKNDFRASGSGNSIYDHNEIDIRCVELSFLLNSKLACQSVAFDYIFDQTGNPRLVEISYGFVSLSFPGFWDQDLNWHEELVNPAVEIIENFIGSEKLCSNVIASKY